MDPRFSLRDTYLDARKALRENRLSSFNRLAARLQDYPLYPYLEYYRLRSRLSTASARDVSDFYQRYRDVPAAQRLHQSWLIQLGRNHQWQTLLQNHEPSNSAELACYHARALHETGQVDQAMRQTTSLWIQPRSQPKACDPLFDLWRASDYFTEEVAWQRLHGALNANEVSLARYLTRYFTGDNKTAAEAYYRVHVAPASISQTKRHDSSSPRMQVVIEHGLRRLAQRDPDSARRAWRRYQATGHFDAASSARIEQLITVAEAEDGTFPSAEQRDGISDPSAQQEIATAALRAGNWPELRYWIDRLPQDLQSKSQWQYWRSRASLEITADQSVLAELTELARERHYYGFMAARLLGVPGQLNSEHSAISGAQLNLLRRNPHIDRSLELFAVGEEINARREWYRALELFEPTDQLAAAELAARHGMTSLAIHTANIADAHNHLHLRFPVVYEPQFLRASLRTSLPAPLLIAIARQESALRPDARSSANARGLMQLLPSTAKLAASRASLPEPSTADLYDPGTNIALGSYHLAWLVQRYQGQTPLAIAAYNAGEHRVDRWIKDAEGVPMDLWIERIPFRETRNYVKNVLAFRHVYAHQLDSLIPILSNAESTVSVP